MKKIIFVGGGASAFFCAANIDETKYHIIILEQNAEVLQKVKISGGGRCNVAHACFDPKELINYYPRGSRELLSVFTKFQPGDTMDWFETRNVPLKIEDDGRIFPESNSSKTIIDTFQKEISSKNIEVKTQCVVKQILKKDSGYTVITKGEELEADIVIFTPGSSPKTLKIIEELGHSTIPAVPSLFTFNIKDELLSDLPGISFLKAEISIPKLKTDESGPLLITHWGLSGPAILKISAWKARELADLKYQFEITVNFLGIALNDAEDIFKNYRYFNAKKSIGSSKIFEITTRFWHRILWLSKVHIEKNIAQLSKVEIQNILENLCSRKMKVSGKSTYKDEFVTAGGVNLKEINFKNMQSKILPNFYLAGEVLNVDAVTGGFNFQACWSEAWLIAQDLNLK